MFFVTFFDFYRHKWDTQYARCLETMPKTWDRHITEIHLAQGMFNRDDSRTVYYTTDPFYVYMQMELPFNEVR